MAYFSGEGWTLHPMFSKEHLQGKNLYSLSISVDYTVGIYMTKILILKCAKSVQRTRRKILLISNKSCLVPSHVVKFSGKYSFFIDKP